MRAINVSLLFQAIFTLLALHANAANYYVNDASNAGDRWCSAVGNDANNGTAVSTPKLTLASVLSSYDLGAGDIVYIDNGTYSWNSICWSCVAGDDYGTGTGANVLTIQGAGTGGTYTTDITCNDFDVFYINSDTYDYITFDGLKLTATNTLDVFQLLRPDYITISNCTLIAVGAGSSCIYTFNSVTNLTVTNNQFRATSGSTRAMEYDQGDAASDHIIERNHFDGVNGSEATYGIYDLQACVNFTCRNNFFSNFLQGVYRDQDRSNALFYNNSFYCKNYCLHLAEATISTTIKNNIFYCYGSTGSDYPLWLESTSNFTGSNINYNLYYTAGSNVARWHDNPYTDLAAWKLATNSPEANGATGDPGYTSPTGCNLAIGSGSPAANAGITGLVTNDISNGSRANPPEIGAFEVGSLPVTLLAFDAKCNNKQLQFHWSTASEINNDFFTLEQSKDLKNWTPLFTTKGAGNSNQIINYEKTEETSSPGISYYRLKQTDFDGRCEYSYSISSGNCNSTIPEISVFPNPSEGHFHIVFSGKKEEILSIEISNALGQSVYYSSGPVADIDLSGQAAGTYILKVNLYNSTLFRKIEVIK